MAIALPPLRPFTIRKGTRPSAASASLDSAAPIKPTGRPITAAGGLAPASSSSSRRNRAVRCRLPIATTELRPAAHPTTPSRRPCACCRCGAGDARHGRIVERADDLVARRQLRTRDAIWRPSSDRTGSGRRRAAPSAHCRQSRFRRITMSRAISIMPQAWMMRTATRFLGRREAREVDSARMMANERR